MTKKWWKEGIVYQIYPRSYYDSNGDGIGDLRGVIDKLDYLKELGVDIIWLNPVYQSPNADNGYDVSNYFRIMNEFGTMEDFDELLEAAHQRGIRLIMDMVLNHSSDEHDWFIKSSSSKDNPYRDYYIWREGKNGKEPNNWQSAFGGSAWQYDAKTKEYYLHVYAVKQPDLNWENPKLRKEAHNIVRWWLDKGIDGFRMDAISSLSKVQEFPDDNKPLEKFRRRIGSRYYINGPKIHEYLQEMNQEVFSKYNIVTIGEATEVTAENAYLYVDEKRHELDIMIHFQLMEVDYGDGGKLDIVPWKLKDFKAIMYKWYVELKDRGWAALYLNNHDQPRMVSRFGNDREYRVESSKMLATLLHTWSGTPFIYQGEEIGMTNVAFDNISDYNDIETVNMYNEKIKQGYTHERLMQIVHKTSRDNARTPMQWDSGVNAGFSKGKPWMKLNPNFKTINVEDSIHDADSIFHYYQKLIKLRKENSVIVYGDLRLILEDHDHIFAYIRMMGQETILVILNFFDQNEHFILPSDIKYRNLKLLLCNYQDNDVDKIENVLLRPYEARIYKFTGIEICPN